MPPEKPTAKTRPGDRLALLYAKADKESAQSLAKYLDWVLIDCRPEPQPFGTVAEGWQRDRNEWVVPAFEFVAGLNPDYSGPKNFWLGYAKGQDKSSYLARCLNWTLAYAKRPLRMYCCASDREQAEVIYDAMRREGDLNPWLAKHLDFKRNLVVGRDNGAKLDILASDAGGAHGKTPDVLICDEVTHWADSSLWQAMYSATEKRGGHCLTLILTNAGFLGTWQDELRQLAKQEHGKDWFFFEQPVGVKLASWMKGGKDSAARKFLTEFEARRLFDNEWLDPSLANERYLSPEEVEACVGEPRQPPREARVVLGIDYGGVHDRTALAAVWFDGRKVHVAELTCFQGSREDEVRIAAVEEWIEARLRKYPRCTVVVDRYQMVGTIQKLERRGADVRPVEYRGGKYNFSLALTLRHLIQNRKLVFAETAGLCGGETLAGELKRLVVKSMVYGWRWDHTLNGYDDKSTAVAVAAQEAYGQPPPPEPGRPPKPKDEELTPARPAPNSAFGSHPLSRRGLYGLNS